MTHTFKFTEHTLTRQRLMVSQMVPKAMLESLNPVDLQTQQDVITGRLMIQLHTYVWGKQVADQTVRYPATWLDAVKARWFPAWALARWPARETVVEFTAHHDYPTMVLDNHEPRLRVMRSEHTVSE